MKLRSRKPQPAPPLTVPRINSRVALLTDGARYTARLDDIEPGHLVVAAPDVHMTPERPVLVEWRDPTGVWQLPTAVTETREAPFDTIVLRPTGPAECISESQVASPGGGMRVTARAVADLGLPERRADPGHVAPAGRRPHRLLDDHAPAARRPRRADGPHRRRHHAARRPRRRPGR